MPTACSGRAAGRIVGRTYCREDVFDVSGSFGSDQSIERLDLALDGLAIEVVEED